MVIDESNIAGYLKPIDLESLPKRRGRQASEFYPLLIEAFVSSGAKAMEVDVERLGRKPETVRSAIAKAIKGRGLQKTVRVSLIGGEVILLLR